jgi:lipoprotein-anchoring transpeptidase ErfK/SrfK
MRFRLIASCSCAGSGLGVCNTGWASMVLHNRTVSPSDRKGGRFCCVPLGRGAATAVAAASLAYLGMFAPAVAFPYGEYGPYGGNAPREVYARPLFGPPRLVRKHPEPTKGADPAKSQSAKTAKPQPPKPVGPLIIAISIGSQHVTVYDNGSPVATAPVSTGMQGRPTPMGVFSVIQKEIFHRSNLYSNAPMPYMQRITWSGVALHAGVLPGYPASHGCIRLPPAFAIRLWGMTRVGARVVVTRNDVTPFEINHPRLAALALPPADVAAQPTVVAALHDGDRGATASSLPIERLAGDDRPVELRPALDVQGPFGPEEPVPLPQARPADAAMRAGAISLFVSRKEGKLFVRKGFEPIFDVPVTIARRDVPLGTHVFTAGRRPDGADGLRWLAVSILDRPVAQQPEPVKGKPRTTREEKPAEPSAEALRRAATEALDRIELPQEALDRIIRLVTPGASLVIADQGLGEETGKETDFIVLTR